MFASSSSLSRNEVWMLQVMKTCFSSVCLEKKSPLCAWLCGPISCLFAKEGIDEVISLFSLGCSPWGSCSSLSPSHAREDWGADIACQGITWLQVSPCSLVLWWGSALLGLGWTGEHWGLRGFWGCSPTPSPSPLCSLEAICSLQPLVEGPDPERCK